MLGFGTLETELWATKIGSFFCHCVPGQFLDCIFSVAMVSVCISLVYICTFIPIGIEL